MYYTQSEQESLRADVPGCRCKLIRVLRSVRTKWQCIMTIPYIAGKYHKLTHSGEMLKMVTVSDIKGDVELLLAKRKVTLWEIS